MTAQSRLGRTGARGDVYPTNFMFRRRRIRTEREEKDDRMETRVKVDGCRALEAV